MNRIKSVFVRNLVSGSLDTDSASTSRRGSIIATRIYTIVSRLVRTKITVGTARQRAKFIWIRGRGCCKRRILEWKIVWKNSLCIIIIVLLFYNKYEIKFKKNAIVVRSSKDEKRNARPNYRADKPNPVSTPRFPPTTPKLRSRLIHRRKPLLDPLDPLYECGASSAKDHHVLRPIPYYTPWSLSPENLIPVSSYYNSLEILAK